MSRFGSGTDTSLRLVLRKFASTRRRISSFFSSALSQPLSGVIAGKSRATIISPPLDLMAKKEGFKHFGQHPDLSLPISTQTVENHRPIHARASADGQEFSQGFIEGFHFAAKNKEHTRKPFSNICKRRRIPRFLKRPIRAIYR